MLPDTFHTSSFHTFDGINRDIVENSLSNIAEVSVFRSTKDKSHEINSDSSINDKMHALSTVSLHLGIQTTS